MDIINAIYIVILLCAGLICILNSGAARLTLYQRSLSFKDEKNTLTKEEEKENDYLTKEYIKNIILALISTIVAVIFYFTY
ncbi:MAG: hypothetical protein WC788_05835 [Candidatus Paceibacterota bacterium]|jgi:hypothetical protein